MAKYTIDSSTLTDIADAIRGQYGETDKIAVTDFAEAIANIEGGGGSNGLFYQEFQHVGSAINLNGEALLIPLDVDDVEFLIIFPLNNGTSGQYLMTGGIYIPSIFGALDRTSYGSYVMSTIGARSGSEIQVNKGMLRLAKGQNVYIQSDVTYGIIGKAREN